MQLTVGGDHDPCVATYQTLEVARLNQVLKDCGLADRQQRRKICETYFFHSGYFLDSGWFEEAGSRYHPVLCFQEVSPSGELTENLVSPDPEFGTELHEYAHGAAAWLFDEHGEDASEISLGDVANKGA